MQFDHDQAPIGGHLGGPTASRQQHRQQSKTAGSLSGAESMEIVDRMVPAGTMKARDVFPDLHHKMSKKIAQLTKVIYHLNTKNEDRQASCEWVEWLNYCCTGTGSHPFLRSLSGSVVPKGEI